MSNQDNDYQHSTSYGGDQLPQQQALAAAPEATVALTVDDVDAIAREINDLPRVERFDVKDQLARLGPTLDGMRIKGYDLAYIRAYLAARGIQASISSISRAIKGDVIAEPKSKKPKTAK